MRVVVVRVQVGREILRRSLIKILSPVVPKHCFPSELMFFGKKGPRDGSGTCGCTSRFWHSIPESTTVVALFGVRELNTLYNIAKSSLIPDTLLPRALLRDPAAYTGTNVSKARDRRSAKEFRGNGGPT